MYQIPASFIDKLVEFVWLNDFLGEREAEAHESLEPWRPTRFAEIVIIHEALHTLGLGEDPPSSEMITATVEASCYR